LEGLPNLKTTKEFQEEVTKYGGGFIPRKN